MTQEELNKLNKRRSTGSRGGKKSPDLDFMQEARDYLRSMEKAAKEDSATAQPLEGQTALPGFEDTQEPATDAEAIKQRVRLTGFKMDYLRSPEDALAALNGSGQFASYMGSRYMELVNATAEELGADPAQVADSTERTPEQEAKLYEIAARDQLRRITAFLDSLYAQALFSLDGVQGTLERQISPDTTDSVSYWIKEQAVLYFFAKHTELTPTKPGTLTEDQKRELQDIFFRLDDFYTEKLAEGADTEEFYSASSSLFSAFIELDNPEGEDAKAIQEAIANIPLLQGVSPTSHLMPNNYLMNALQKQSIIEHPEAAKGWDLPVFGEKGRLKNITAYTMVTYDPGDSGITISGANLTEYERQVSDAVVSLWRESEKTGTPALFTPDMIYRAMPGGSEKASDAQKAAIDRTIEKLRRLHVVVDATEEARKRGAIGKDKKFEIDSFFLSVTKLSVKAKNGGQLSVAYRVDSEPIILTYSKMAKQVLTAPARFLAIEKVKMNPRTGKKEPSGELVSMSADRQAMVGYMLRRVAVMKHDKKNKIPKQSRTILFDTLFKETGTQTDSRTQQSRDRDFCFSVLDYWKATGYIQDYKLQSKGKKIEGVVIAL